MAKRVIQVRRIGAQNFLQKCLLTRDEEDFGQPNLTSV